MSWVPYSLHFKQVYADGYRYLDRCGELILAAKEYEFMPGEVNLTGGQLTIPERLIQANVGPHELTMKQDLPPAGDYAVFLAKSEALAGLATKLFGPLDVQSNGFAIQFYWPVKSAEEALQKSLRFRDALQDRWAKELDMISSGARLDFNFQSGNLALHVVVQAVTFENVTVQQHNVSFSATREQKTRVQRLQNSKRDFPQDIAHALLMNVDLRENDPPTGKLNQHFNLLCTKADILLKQFT